MAGKGLGARRLRTVIVTASLMPVLAGPGSAQAASKPTISELHAFPATVASGGVTSVHAKVTGAATCTLSAPKSKPVGGLSGSFPCPEGAMRVFALPANKGKKAAEYKLTLTALAANDTAKTKAKLTIKVLPEEVALADKQLISVSFDATCAIAAKNHAPGQVYCWGGKDVGDLGDEGINSGYSPTPVAVKTVTNAVELASGAAHTCALLATGHVKCWGASIGLGAGSLVNFGQGSSTPVAVGEISNAVFTELSNVVQIAAGFADTCALLNTGEVKCWGLNSIGQLGQDLVDPVENFSPIPLPAVVKAVELSAGREDTCARLDDGTVACWGGNGHGELGDGGIGRESFVPHPISAVKHASQLSAGENHDCAVIHEEGQPPGQIMCWGWDNVGQVGDGTLGYAVVAGKVKLGEQPLAGAVQVSAAYEHTCALVKATVDCWGTDAKGQLGDGAPGTQEITAVAVKGPLEHVVEINAAFSHTCALLEDGTIKCWGADNQAQLGTEVPELFSAVPVTVRGFPPVSAAARRAAARHKRHRKAKRHRTHH